MDKKELLFKTQHIPFMAMVGRLDEVAANPLKVCQELQAACAKLSEDGEDQFLQRLLQTGWYLGSYATLLEEEKKRKQDTETLWAETGWELDDVLQRRPNWTPEEAEEWLESYHLDLLEATIRAGNEWLDDNLPEEIDEKEDNRCPSCEIAYINGIRCHEKGCPEAWRDYEKECKECGCSFKPEDKYQIVCSDCLEELETAL